jgi:hypothetical protein
MSVLSHLLRLVNNRNFICLGLTANRGSLCYDENTDIPKNIKRVLMGFSGLKCDIGRAG